MNPASSFFLSVKPVLAQGLDWTGRCVGTGQASDVATIQGLECLFANVLLILTSVAGFVFFGMFVVGGFQFISSQGDPKAIAGASTTLTNALIGLVGLIGSFLILRTIATLTGINQILFFTIPGGN